MKSRKFRKSKINFYQRKKHEDLDLKTPFAFQIYYKPYNTHVIELCELCHKTVAYFNRLLQREFQGTFPKKCT